MSTMASASAASAPARTPLSKRAGFHIPCLDGVRAIAFLMVFLNHMEIAHPNFGVTGVAIFFFLSGYLITTLLRREFAAKGSISFSAFYTRRAFRIWPLLYLTMAIAGVLSALHWISGGYTPGSLAMFLGQISNYYIDRHGAGVYPGGLGVLWSLCVEEHFYLIFPLLFLFLQRYSRRVQAGVIGGLCALDFVWREIMYHLLHATPDRVYCGTDTRYDGILFGCFLAVAFNPLFEAAPRWFLRRPRLYASLGLVVLLAADHVRLIENSSSLYSLVGLSLIPIFWLMLAKPEDPSVAWLEWPWIRQLGIWSYCLYLIHSVFIDGFGSHIPLPAPYPALLSFPLSLAFAWAAQKLVEGPCHNLRNRLLRRWHQRTSYAEPATVSAEAGVSH
jgi:peptidoglycan/LPS O-acetylase OafA/YrhL